MRRRTVRICRAPRARGHRRRRGQRWRRTVLIETRGVRARRQCMARRETDRLRHGRPRLLPRGASRVSL
eukprot:6076245-Prymnesium_polylepis.1